MPELLKLLKQSENKATCILLMVFIFVFILTRMIASATTGFTSGGLYLLWLFIAYYLYCILETIITPVANFYKINNLLYLQSETISTLKEDS
jgi:flagellar basal body-associated protein FliL